VKINITSRESQVLELLSFGNSSIEIADQLHLSRETIRSHRKRLRSKLDVQNSAELIRLGFELGLLHPRKQNNTLYS